MIWVWVHYHWSALQEWSQSKRVWGTYVCSSLFPFTHVAGELRGFLRRRPGLIAQKLFSLLQTWTTVVAGGGLGLCLTLKPSPYPLRAFSFTVSKGGGGPRVLSPGTWVWAWTGSVRARWNRTVLFAHLTHIHWEFFILKVSSSWCWGIQEFSTWSNLVYWYGPIGSGDKALANNKLFGYFSCTYISLRHFTGKMGSYANTVFKYSRLLYLKNIY